MLPVLFHIGSRPIYSFGLLTATGILVALILIQKDAKHFKISEAKLGSILTLIIITGLFGSRLFYVLISKPLFFIEHPLEFFKFWNGGMVFYGGLLFCIIAVWFFAKKNKMSFLDLVDFLIPYLPLAHIFGRIGCFLNGCCYGLPTDLPWGISVTNTQSVTRPLGVPLHPTQLYEAMLNLIIFIILYRTGRRKKFKGQCVLLYGMLYPVGRSIIEIFRGDTERGFIISGIISTSQGISILIFVMCLIIYLKTIKKHRTK